VEIYLAYYNQE